MTLVHRNGSAEGVNLWLKATVQQFFQDIDWENSAQTRAPASSSPSPSASAGAPEMPPDLTLKVSQFFEAIAWEGTPAIAAPAPVEEPDPPSSSADQNVTLDDFFGGF